jgi:RNA polymerase sigma factor (sigma-70 family)
MPHDDSISRWIHDIKQGDSAAATALWHEYFEKLVRLARKKLDGVAGKMADEEDVALSAFKSFCLAAKTGRFPDLLDRDGLWRLLIRMTARKAVDLRRHEGRECRGGGRVRGESGLTVGKDETQGIADVIGDSPNPQLAAQLAEELELQLSQFDPQQRQIVLAKMEGYTNREIADRLSIAPRTVERRLQFIRRKWESLEGNGQPEE